MGVAILGGGAGKLEKWHIGLSINSSAEARIHLRRIKRGGPGKTMLSDRGLE